MTAGLLYWDFDVAREQAEWFRWLDREQQELEDEARYRDALEDSGRESSVDRRELR